MRWGLGIAAIILILDQLSKYWVINFLMPLDAQGVVPFYIPYSVPVLPFFDLVMVWNRGVSFGLFNNDSAWNPIILSILSVTITLILLVWMKKAGDRFLRGALGLIIGGAIGNMIDRLRFGAVADFIDLHAFGYHWPAFNIADSAICVGAAMLFIHALFAERFSHKNEA